MSTDRTREDEYVLYDLPSEVWAIEFRNLYGDRVIEVVATEQAAREAAEHYGLTTAVLFRSSTQFRQVE
jgi:hypothetical protein